MTAYRLEDPLWLLMLVPIVAVGASYIRRRNRTALLYSDVTVIETLPGTLSQKIFSVLPWIHLLGLSLIVLALARPQSGREEFRVRTEGIAIEMCIDRSGSMQALDFPIDGQRVSRLDAVKHVFRQFVSGEASFDGRPDDLIGLVAFGGFADALCPPTLDHELLLKILKDVQIARPVRDSRGRILNREMLREEQATAIGDAIAVAVDRLKNVNAKSKIILILSDGENTAGVVPPEEAAELAAAFEIRIYSIGIGSTGSAPFPATDLFGRDMLRAQRVELDEQLLKMLAAKTDGTYFNAQSTDSLKQVIAEIDQLEKTKTEGRLYTDYKEYFQPAAIAGISLIVISYCLSATRFRSLP